MISMLQAFNTHPIMYANPGVDRQILAWNLSCCASSCAGVEFSVSSRVFLGEEVVKK